MCMCVVTEPRWPRMCTLHWPQRCRNTGEGGGRREQGGGGSSTAGTWVKGAWVGPLQKHGWDGLPRPRACKGWRGGLPRLG